MMNSLADASNFDPERVEWDVIVCGTGMGGGTLGYCLARAGRRVLFVEKGRSFLDPQAPAYRGITAEEVNNFSSLPDAKRDEVLSLAGRSIDQIEDHSAARARHYRADVGCGTGGSSALYGMVLERLYPADFEPAEHHQVAQSTLPDRWPISYRELEPYYLAAERLYRVRGTPDPLRNEPQDHLLPPPPLTPANDQVYQFLKEQGCHPYHLHLACEYVPGCECCQGFLCPRECKNDSARVCLLPAVREHAAQVLSQCAAIRLEASGHAVARLVCDWQGRRIALRGKYFVLAAGALATPVLLLNSRDQDWPRGIANRSGLVGRNLMRHALELVVLRPKDVRAVGNTKELAFNDFYLRDGKKFGSVQSVGPLPPLLASMGKLGPRWRWVGYLRQALTPAWNFLRARVIPLAAIVEDLPYHDNRVWPAEAAPGMNSAPAFRLEYRLREEGRQRAQECSQALVRLFKPLRAFGASASGDNKLIAHVCGTCRFGTDPRTSVLDRDCRAHDLDNLYVVDASFFPSSGGINPSLTIAANALRVADHLIARFGQTALPGPALPPANRPIGG
jgi:choline dehydrogenase-like flavoprotein